MSPHTSAALVTTACLGLALAALVRPTPSIGDALPEPPPVAKNALATPQSFANISDVKKRSQALFTEASRVLTHPRCVNCHPDGDRPLQGEDGHLHEPPVRRGTDGFGAIGMRCQTCHWTENFDPGRVPGSENWHLAPRSMAWQGKTPAQICAQIKDPKRNGNRTLEQIGKHMNEDHLVGWAWHPGADRAPPPGDQKAFGALVNAWLETGAACPK